VTLLLLALLPEIVLFSAIIVTLERVQVALARKSLESWIWAILFLLPTLSFFAMSLYTLTTLALTGEISKQAHWAVVIRVLSAYLYALVGMIWANWQQGERKCTQSEQQVNTSLQGLEDANKAIMQEAIEQLSSMTIQLVEERLTIARSCECSPAQIEAFTVSGQNDEESEQTGVQTDEKPVLCVPGISQEKVEQILALHLAGTPWRDIPGNYSRTIKPIKDAYEALYTGERG